jgi:hypothetical protein
MFLFQAEFEIFSKTESCVDIVMLFIVYREKKSKSHEVEMWIFWIVYSDF